MKNKLLFLTLLFTLSLTLVSCKNRNFDDSFQTQSGYYENMKKQMEGADDISLDTIDDIEDEELDKDESFRAIGFSSDRLGKEYFIVKAYEHVLDYKADYHRFEMLLLEINEYTKRIESAYSKLAPYVDKHPEVFKVEGLIPDGTTPSDLLYMLIAKTYLSYEILNVNHENDEQCLDVILSVSRNIDNNDMYPIEQTDDIYLNGANRINKYIFEDLNKDIIEANKILKDAKKLYDEREIDGNIRFMK
ncbi:MAG: hypothetical protein MJ245_04790 [Clostridia bacterium]|nr:hypothetical protein [Clostridia bacterium]